MESSHHRRSSTPTATHPTCDSPRDVAETLRDPDRAHAEPTARAERSARTAPASSTATLRRGGTTAGSQTRSRPRRTAFDDAFDRWRELYRDGADRVATSSTSSSSSTTRRERDRHGRRARRRADAREPASPAAQRRHRARARPTSTPTATSPPRASCPATPSRGCRWPPTSRRAEAAPEHDGDYLQRPRFLAISEFGPAPDLPRGRPLRGHPRPAAPRPGRDQRHGATPRTPGAARLRLPPPRRRSALDVCEHCGGDLGAHAVRAAAAADRVHPPPRADQQRRGGAPQSGLRARDSYRFATHGDRAGRRRRRSRRRRGSRAGSTSAYGDAADDPGRQRRPPPPQEPDDRGFWLDLARAAGSPTSRPPTPPSTPTTLDDAEDVARKEKVIPYVEDRRNILVLRLSQAGHRRGGGDHLRCALERGIEASSSSRTPSSTAERCPTRRPRPHAASPRPPKAAPASCADCGSPKPGRSRRRPRRRWRSSTSTRTPAPTSATRPAPGNAASGAATTACCPTPTSTTTAASTGTRVRDLLLQLAGAHDVEAGAGGRRERTSRAGCSRATPSWRRRFVDWLDATAAHRLPTTPSAPSRPPAPAPTSSTAATGPVAVFVDGPPTTTTPAAERDAAAEDAWTTPAGPSSAFAPRRRLGSARGTQASRLFGRRTGA